jgi:putative ABC transport system permease protein
VKATEVLTGSIRDLRIARGSLATAFAILAVAMTAATVTFSVVDAVAFRRLPYARPSRLVGIAQPADRPGRIAPVTPSDYFLLKERTQAFTDLAASRAAPPVRLGDSSAAEPLVTRAVTTNLFTLLGVRAAAGRLFAEGDDRPAGPKAAVISHQLWSDKFGARDEVIGSSVPFATESLQIIGVLPAGVWHPMELNPPSVYVPYVATPSERANTRSRTMSVVGRLSNGMSLRQARADVTRVVTIPVVVQSLTDQVVGTARGWLFLLLAAVMLVLSIACVNVATLLLARATTRAREFAIRASLGEPRRALIAGVFVEGLLLALAAGAVAIVLSYWGVEVAKAALPQGLLTRVTTIAVDGRVIIASLGMAALCAIAFGAAPAWVATRANLYSVMGSGGGAIVGGRRIDRSLAAFLVVEVTTVCVLLVAATLIVRSFIEVTTTELGFERANVATVEYMRPSSAASQEALRIEGSILRQELLAAARRVPGVVVAAIAVNGPVPLAGASVRYSIVVPDYGQTLNEDMLEMRIVTPEYFTAMGMQLVSGRLLNDGDRLGAPRAIVINEEAAARFFRGRNPVGRVVSFRTPTTVVGVLRSVRFEGPEGGVRPEMYISAEQEPMPFQRQFGSIVVRTNGQARDVGATVREAMRPVLGAEPGPVQLVDDHFGRLTAGRRFNASVMAVFGAIAIALGIAGVYSTMQFLVSRQRRDIGLRLALGATRGRIMRAVLTAALSRVSLGLACGLAVTWMISSAFRSFVFGVTPTDPSTYAQVAASIALFGVIAALLPAWRAARLDPVDTLRRE